MTCDIVFANYEQLFTVLRGNNMEKLRKIQIEHIFIGVPGKTASLHDNARSLVSNLYGSAISDIAGRTFPLRRHERKKLNFG